MSIFVSSSGVWSNWTCSYKTSQNPSRSSENFFPRSLFHYLSVCTRMNTVSNSESSVPERKRPSVTLSGFCLVFELFRNQDTAVSKQQLWSHYQCLQSSIGHQCDCNVNGEHAAAAGACQHNLESDIHLFFYPTIHLVSLRVEGVLESVTAVLRRRQCPSRHNTESLRVSEPSGCEVALLTMSNFFVAILSTLKLSFLLLWI